MSGEGSPSAVVDRAVAFVRASFRRKLAAALLVVLLISGAAALGLYVQIGALIDDNVEQSMTAAADDEAGELTEWSRQNRLIARVLSEHPVYEEGNRTAVRSYLQQQLADRRESRIVNAYLVDRRTLTVETSALPELEGAAVADLPWQSRFAFRTFDDVRITRPHEAADGETVVVGFVTPVRRIPGHLLVVTVEAASIFERFEHPVDGGFTRVVDSNGTVVFADSRSAMLQQYHPGARRVPAVSRGLQGESGFVDDSRYQGGDRSEDYVAAFAPVEGTDWVVIEHAPSSRAYAITREAGVWIGGIVAIALAGLLAVVAVLGADVTGALAALAGRAERIEQGEYDVAFDTERPDEFGDLNRTFARTRDTLRHRIEEIEETKEALAVSNVALENRSTMVSVLNRILRHNVRTDVNNIAGRAELLADRIDDDELRAELEVIERTALGLTTVADRTRRIQDLLSEDPSERVRLPFPDCLVTPLENVRDAWPAATIRLDVPGDEGPVADGTASFPVAVADVVEQIVAHNDGAVTVDITVSRAGGERVDGTDARAADAAAGRERNETSTTEAARADSTGRDGANGPGGDVVVLTIADDGYGLPDLDIQAVGRGEETPLDHAEGLALWCLEWTVDRGAGTLVVDPADATVEVRLPAAATRPDDVSTDEARAEAAVREADRNQGR